MPILDNPNDGELAKIKLLIRQLLHGNPQQSMSITRGQVRIGGTGQLLVDSSGGLVVNGTIALAGTETIAAGGKIVISGTDALTMGPTAFLGVPGMSWASGGSLGGGSGAVAMIASGGNSTVQASPTSAQMFVSSQQVLVTSSGVAITAPTTTSAANLFMNSTTGLLSRVTSARRFKIGPKLMKLAPSILDVRMKDWIDRTARKNKEPDVRVPGVIAEEIYEAGGESFITRDAEGEIEGVMYDRLAVARTQILADKLDAALKRIEVLENKLAA